MGNGVSSEFDVAVVGAGVAGLAAALGLAQGGLRVALVGPPARRFAPSDAAPFDARIYALSAGSLRLLERLKVWPQVDPARVQPVERMRIYGDRGAELRFDAYQAAVERLATIAEEAELLRVLQAGIAYAPGVVRFESGMSSLAVDEKGATLQLEGGSALNAALVVGADGGNSAVRAAAGIHPQVHDYGQTAVVANFAAARPHHATAWQWFTDEGVVALLPLPQQCVSLVWSAPQALAQALLQMSEAERTARVQARVQDELGALAPRGPAHGFPLRRVRVSPHVAARVALVGDAAHIVHPLAGQGLNLGLQDVSDLLDVVAAREHWRDLGDRVLLRRYARARAEPVERMTLATDGLMRLFGRDDALVSRVRNAGLALVDRIGPLKRALVREALG